MFCRYIKSITHHIEAYGSAKKSELVRMKYPLHSSIQEFPASESHILAWQHALYCAEIDCTVGPGNSVGLQKGVDVFNGSLIIFTFMYLDEFL